MRLFGARNATVFLKRHQRAITWRQQGSAGLTSLFLVAGRKRNFAASRICKGVYGSELGLCRWMTIESPEASTRLCMTRAAQSRVVDRPRAHGERAWTLVRMKSVPPPMHTNNIHWMHTQPPPSGTAAPVDLFRGSPTGFSQPAPGDELTFDPLVSRPLV